MNQRWTLHVENFARIESADIEIAPIMCLIEIITAEKLSTNIAQSYLKSSELYITRNQR